MAKEPLALAKVQQCTLAQGKVLGATRHGASVPLSVFTAYKPPGPSLEILPVFTEYVRHLGDKPWCLGGDFNLNPRTGALPDALFGHVWTGSAGGRYEWPPY